MEKMTNEETITVTGYGSVHVVPDVIRLELTIKGQHGTYNDAYDMAKNNNKKIANAMKMANLDVKLPKTTSLDISEHEIRQYDKFGNFTDYKREGYDLSQEVKIDIQVDNHLLGILLSSIGQMIPNTQITIGYTVKDPKPARLKMLERAVLDAKEKAAIMAGAANCELGRVKSIEYGQENIKVYAQARNIHSSDEALACNEESLDISPNDLSVSDKVKVIWFLKNNPPRS